MVEVMMAHMGVSVFDSKTRIDKNYKKRTARIFSYLNDSARAGCDASRTLIEEWFSRIPTGEQEDLRSRFRCGDDAQFASAFHELFLHELFLRQSCKPIQHPAVANSQKRPDFHVSEPDGYEFLLEARTISATSTGPEMSAQRNQVMDFLQQLKLPGFSLGVDQLEPGRKNLNLRYLEKHIRRSLNDSRMDNSDRFSLPVLETDDGWKIKITAIPDVSEAKKNVIRYEVWSRIGSARSYTLHDALKEKARRYGNEFVMPFMIAANSFDATLATRDFEESLFGEHGLWGTPSKPKYGRVSAVLFTKNLWPQTLLMGLVESRLYLNPFADLMYRGTLTKLDTFAFEGGSWQCYSGTSIDQLLNLHLLDSSLWN